MRENGNTQLRKNGNTEMLKHGNMKVKVLHRPNTLYVNRMKHLNQQIFQTIADVHVSFHLKSFKNCNFLKPQGTNLGLVQTPPPFPPSPPKNKYDNK